MNGISNSEWRAADKRINLFRVPRHSTDSFPSLVIKSQAFLLRFDIPDRDKPSATGDGQNMWDLLVPIKAVNVVGPWS